MMFSHIHKKFLKWLKGKTEYSPQFKMKDFFEHMNYSPENILHVLIVLSGAWQKESQACDQSTAQLADLDQVSSFFGILASSFIK